MSDPRYSAPIPPYAPASGVQDATSGPVIEGRIVDGKAGYAGADSAGHRPGGGHPFGSAYAFTPGAFGGPTAFALPRKSLLLAAVLTALLPPFGMAYSTFFGMLVMLFVGLPVLLFTGGGAWPVLYPMAIAWAVLAAHGKNQRSLALARYLQPRG